MQSKYRGKCPRCGHDYHSGTIIEKRGERWYPVDCLGCRNMEMAHALIDRMLEKHQISMGLNFTPGVKMIETRREFLNAAIELGEATREEIDAFRKHHAGLMDRSLYD